MHPLAQWVMVVFSAAVIAGCEPIVDARGYNIENADLTQIVVGQSRMEDVEAILGSPTTRATFGEPTWYYISERKETKGMFAPEVTDQKVVAIRFDADQLVTAVEQHSKDASQPVQIVDKTTPTAGRRLGFMEQLLGNVGRFKGSSGGMGGPRGPSPMGGPGPF